METTTFIPGIREHFSWHVLPMIGTAKTKSFVVNYFQQNDEINTHHKTTNYVFNLNDKAYVKIGRTGDDGSAIMEEFVWENACIFGVQNHFTPTNTIRISPRKAEKLKIDKVVFSKLNKNPNTIGSFQPALQGILLNTIIEKKISIFEFNKERGQIMNNLIEACVTAHVFGMRDANAENILIMGDGQIIFIDNANSFANSPSLVAVGSSVYLIHRCGLIELPECHIELTASEKEYLINYVKKLESKLPEFEQYVRSETVQKKLAKLPKGWFDTEMVIESTRTQINRLLDASELTNVKTLADYTYHNVPFYRLFALAFLCKHDVNKATGTDFNIWRIASTGAATLSLPDVLEICENKSIDPFNLLDLSNENDFTPADFIFKLKELLDRERTSIPILTLSKFADSMLLMSHLDLKDIPSGRVVEFIGTYVKKLLTIQFVGENDPKIRILKYSDGEKEFYINFNDDYQRSKFSGKLDHLSKPGYLLFVENTEFGYIEVKKFKKWVDLNP